MSDFTITKMVERVTIRLDIDQILIKEVWNYVVIFYLYTLIKLI